jgi:hypothetical protein
VTRAIVPGEIQPNMTVWPAARTPTAPAICYQQPRCIVVAVAWPYAEVRHAPQQPGTKGIRAVPVGPRHRVHVDNLLRRDPGYPRRPARPCAAITTTGYVQPALF